MRKVLISFLCIYFHSNTIAFSYKFLQKICSTTCHFLLYGLVRLKVNCIFDQTVKLYS